jgi:hypothetical protein
LWGHTTGPEDRHIVGGNRDGIPEIRALDVTDTQGSRVADVDRSSVDGGKATGNLHGAYHLMGW